MERLAKSAKMKVGDVCILLDWLGTAVPTHDVEGLSRLASAGRFYWIRRAVDRVWR
jgi:hypothetical protein